MEVAGETMAQLPAAKARPVSTRGIAAAGRGMHCRGVRFADRSLP